MASAARREVGEEGEIELLTWGMCEKKKKGATFIACKIRAGTSSLTRLNPTNK